jgi:proline dehydrogenase
MIMNTYQASLKRTKRNVCLDVLGCKEFGLPFGAKLVRGAYVTEENKLALEQGVESPVFPNKALVDKSYNETMTFVLEQIPPNSHFNVASHNDTSIEIAEQIVEKNKKELGEKNIQISFAQLKGLSDKMTFGLAQRGHYTFKYLPYGPTNHLVPYLFRRAEEASYIWVEGQKKLEDVRHELFDVRKFHYKTGIVIAGGLILLLIIL